VVPSFFLFSYSLDLGTNQRCGSLLRALERTYQLQRTEKNGSALDGGDPRTSLLPSSSSPSTPNFFSSLSW
jgi:hypothetical protein